MITCMVPRGVSTAAVPATGTLGVRTSEWLPRDRRAVEVESVNVRFRELHNVNHLVDRDGRLGRARAAMTHTALYRGLAASLMRGIEDETSELHVACQAVLAASA
jgi:hypothetical protein